MFCVFGIGLLTGGTFLLTAYLNPWTGTKNVYLWSSNFGHDSNVVRLITPGFFDFFKYMQFAVFLTGLSLDYPGFLQPIISSFGWSCLFFSSTIVAHNDGDLTDGLYVGNSTYGLGRLAEISQVSTAYDVWGNFMVCLLILTAGIVIFCEVVAATTWAWKKYKRDTSDLQTRILSFTIGLVMRIFFNLFAYPLLAFSFFQCIITPRGTPIYLTVLAALVIVAWVLVAAWVTFRLLRTKPRQTIYDELNIILRYGTLFNTYNEQGSMFFIVDLITVLLRGVTVGAIQASGLAQLIILAIIELFNFFGILIIKPFDKDTSMNLIACLASTLRFILIFLSLPFLASFEIDVVVRQWLGYVILILHALVVLLFLMHALQVTIEVISRYDGVGADGKAGAIYSLKQLSRRRKKTNAMLEKEHSPSPDSILQKNAIGRMPIEDSVSIDPITPGSRSREDSSLSATLLSRRLTYNGASAGPPSATTRESAFDEYYVSSPISDISSTGARTPLSAPLSATLNNRNSGSYYRKPRRRASSHEWGNVNNYLQKDEPQTKVSEIGVKPEDASIDYASPPPSNVDYAVREADIYYTKHGQYAPERRKKRRHKKRDDDGTEAEEDNVPIEYGSASGSIDLDSYKAHNGHSSNYNDTTGVLTSGKLKSRTPNSLIGLLEDEVSSNTPVVSQEEHNNEGSSSGIAGWFREKRQAFFSKGTEEPTIEPKGFEVIRRGPIRPYQKSDSDESSEADDSVDSEEEDAEPEQPVSTREPQRKMSVMNPSRRSLADSRPNSQQIQSESHEMSSGSFIIPTSSTSSLNPLGKPLSPGRSPPALRLLTSSEALRQPSSSHSVVISLFVNEHNASNPHSN